jgi:phage shock protein PspC (stress-responsive transcriptional regulator)
MKTIKLEKCPCLDKQKEDKNSEGQGMSTCMKGAKWFLLIPGVIITIAFILGYMLNPSAVRVLWLLITGFLMIAGTIFYILMNIRLNEQKQ